MRLHLTSAYQDHPGLDTLLEHALLDTQREHSLCDSAAQADAIVFVENTQFDDVMFKRLRNHQLVQTYPDKVFMYNEMDRPWDVLPGLYTCMTHKHFDPNKHRAFAYLSTPNALIRNIYHEHHERQWLYSFMGAMSHACRRRIMTLTEPRAYLEDTSGFNVWNASQQQMQERSRVYADVIGGSHFILCPRGIGTSSIRLYETLEAGRVPVIISDQWVPPTQSDWSFAMQVSENQIKTLPALLKACENEATERGERARETYLKHFSPTTLFNTLGDSIDSLCTNEKQRSRSSVSSSMRMWKASGELFARTTLQRVRGLR